MKLRARCFLSWLLLISHALLASSVAAAAEEAAEDEIGVRKYGVVHNIADDRKVEKIGGIYEVEGIDKYLKRRLDQVDERLLQLSEQLGSIEQKIENLNSESQSSDNR